MPSRHFLDQVGDLNQTSGSNYGTTKNTITRVDQENDQLLQGRWTIIVNNIENYDYSFCDDAPYGPFHHQPHLADYLRQPQICRTLQQPPQTLYAGFDPTADSLHTGNLMVVMALLHAQRAGHEPIALLGGATGLIGDPSGRQTDRPQLASAIVQDNVDSLQRSLTKLFENHEEQFRKRSSVRLKKVRIVNNADWYQSRNVIQFFSDIARHFRVGQMMHKHSVRSRLESPEGLSFTEFSYQIFQAYDWLHLYREYGCNFQIGGNDQIGNMAAGYELVKKVTNKSVFGLTVPLLTAADGTKLGKSAGNALWLDPEKTTPFEFYQGFLNCPDSDVETQLKLFTVMKLNEIDSLIARHNAEPHLRKAQKKLAEHVTLLVHGDSGLDLARRCTNILFDGSVDDLHQLTADELASLFSSWPRACLDLEPGTTVEDLVHKAKCFSWEGDVDRIIRSGGLYVNMQRCSNPDAVLVEGQHILPTGYSLIRIGKKKFHLVEWRR